MEVYDLEGADAGPSKIKSSHKLDVSALERLNVGGFNWTSYEGTYKDRALITRLMHIPKLILASASPNLRCLALAKAALIRLLPLVKATWDLPTYTRVVSWLDQTAHPEKLGNVSLAIGDEMMDLEGPSSAKGGEKEGVPDYAYIERVREDERKEAAALDVELQGYLSNLIKESIRLTYVAFARLSLKSGNAGQAIKQFTSARDYASGHAQQVEIGLGILETSLAFNMPTSLLGQISKLEASLDRAYPPVIARQADTASTTAADLRDNREREAKNSAARKSVTVKLHVARGVIALSVADYESTAREFGAVIDEGGLGDWEGQAISNADVALITTLSVLATSSRDRIKETLLESSALRGNIDDGETWIMDLIRAFMNAQYAEVNTIMRKAQPMILLNPFLCAHTTALIDLIQTRSMVQYVAPFSSIQLSVMSVALGVGSDELLRAVERLIGEGKIQGKLDLIDMVLIVERSDSRAKLYDNAIKTGSATNKATQHALLRMKMHEARIVVDPGAVQRKMGLPVTDSMEFEEQADNSTFGGEEALLGQIGGATTSRVRGEMLPTY